MSTEAASRILTVGEVAAILGLPGPWTIRNLERRGVFPAPKRAPVTGSRYYFASDIAELRIRLAESTGRAA